MKPAITTWDDLTPGRVLLIVNSRDDAGDELSAACERFAAAGAQLHVVAHPSWHGLLVARGISSDRLLLTVDEQGAALELNYFLETDGIAWILRREFDFVAGSAPHNLYNEEIKDIFEERACLFLRNGLFIAHTLPAAYVYLFDLPGMFDRLGRGVKRARYEATTGRLMADCYELWRAAGSPVHSDEADFSGVMTILGRHLDPAVLEFDERSPTPLGHPSGAGVAAAVVIRQLGDMVRARDQALDAPISAGVRRDIRRGVQRLRRQLAAAAGRDPARKTR